MIKKLPYLLLVLLALFVGFYLYNTYRSAPSIKLSTLNLVNLNNEPVKIDAFRGKKIFLTFGASWCGNCIEELETLRALKENNELGDIEVIVISDEDLERVQGFKTRRGYPFTFLKMKAPFNSIGINAIPTSYVINTKLEIKKETVGYIDWRDPSTREHLKTLMQ